MWSDEQLQQAVLRELHQDPRVEPRHLRVEVTAGRVALTGTVTSCAAAAAARAAAARVPGVRAVESGIQVALPAHAIRTDLDLVRTVHHLLAWDAEVPDERIDIRVAGGIVTLEGQVEHAYQRDVAERAVSHLAGVRGVVNRLAVTTPLPHGSHGDLAAPLGLPAVPLAGGEE
ncbi:MAG TPA: BON domain-containing protein [Chloroflexota bacterium]|nr:BON domain-containing protein [Chloroflexota bacterium]